MASPGAEALKIVLVSVGEPSNGEFTQALIGELERRKIVVLETSVADAEQDIDEHQPHLVVLCGTRGASVLSTLLDDGLQGTRPRLVVTALRSELAKLQGLNRNVVAGLLASDLGERLVVERLQTLARQAAQLRQGLWNKRSTAKAAAAPSGAETSAKGGTNEASRLSANPTTPEFFKGVDSDILNPLFPSASPAPPKTAAPQAPSAAIPRPTKGAATPQEAPSPPETSEQPPTSPEKRREAPAPQDVVAGEHADPAPPTAGQPEAPAQPAAQEAAAGSEATPATTTKAAKEQTPQGEDAKDPEDTKVPQHTNDPEAGNDPEDIEDLSELAELATSSRPAPPDEPRPEATTTVSAPQAEPAPLAEPALPAEPAPSAVLSPPPAQETPAPASKRTAVIVTGLLIAAAAAASVWMFPTWKRSPPPSTQSARASEPGASSATSPTEPSGDTAAPTDPSGSAAPADATDDNADPPSPVDSDNPFRVEEADLPGCEGLLRDFEPKMVDPLQEASLVWKEARDAIVKGDLSTAERNMCAAVKLHPESAALESLALHYLTQHAPRRALTYLERAEAVRPGENETLNLRGDIQSQLGEDEKALDAWLRALKLEPDEASRRRMAAHDYANQGQGHLRRGALPQAERWLRRAVALDPENVPALTGLAEVFLKMERFPQAANIAQRALNLSTYNPQAHVVLGDVARQAGDAEAARKSYEAALAVRSDHWPAKARLRELKNP